MSSQPLNVESLLEKSDKDLADFVATVSSEQQALKDLTAQSTSMAFQFLATGSDSKVGYRI